ncbi:AraC family transcriptional regulator [Streptomyces graminofaciens]|jgi:AraC-like DNA-binding protein|uniref:AraC family transcriptional regulator n=1 Tax=Streptomyces graminofaciens TaxID=68212 RepID=A0ABN5VKZ5_9ACTN|nr:helix-turn-helix domain-containing protein [Streptomyces graminofaciens]BBC34046.1 AraC family transcriptional regulator [Streptomyces graminofaciens]
MSALSVISRATTEHIEPAERIHYWEDYNRKALVGLSCTSYSEQGLLASQTNIELGGLRLAEIAGNAHAIERSPQTVRSAPKDSVFATLLLKGEAVFLHEDGCLAATAGELCVYDTRRPYLFGFSSSMRQILVDVPRDLFTQACVGGGLPGPMLFGRGTAREGALVAALSSRLGGLAAASRGGPYDPADAEVAVLDLLRQLAEERTGGRPGPDAYRSQLIVAEDYIDRHLHDPCLGAAQVAGVMGISVRHLGRIFESTGRSPARHIVERRLVRAHQQLTGPGARETRIADVAHRWGFSSQAHFARLFRSRFGLTPSEARAEAGK